ncbi:hypothetical protein [Holospora curviuscula]|uniref:Uncharacterized protein n=1 Tax=Holospora curviuscula TaxID=1082868 RepID=A0A2S5R872_9PROT|nr:hypothetical protein [Holospora curviuscula]PPE03500.1 hypothetical protein HCUR_01040 [Holospora curviuscula]
MLLKDFSPYSTVHSFYRRFRIKRIWEKVLSALVKIRRGKAGGSEYPSYRRIDSHSVKTTKACKQRGIDGGKKRNLNAIVLWHTQGTLVHGNATIFRCCTPYPRLRLYLKTPYN